MARTSDSTTTGKARPAADGDRGLVAVPRIWLVGLLFLVIVPWLIVAAFSWRSQPVGEEQVQVLVDAGVTTSRAGGHVVEGEYQLGDIIGLVDAEGDLYHVAVHIADNLVFTKNGTSPVTPWTIMPLERVIATTT